MDNVSGLETEVAVVRDALHPLGPPSADVVLFNKHMLEIIKLLHAESAKLTFMLGDYNLDLIKFRSNNSVGEFLDNMISHFFFPKI